MSCLIKEIKHFFYLLVLITALLVCYEFWYNTWKIPVKTVSSGYTIYKQTKAGNYASVHTGLEKGGDDFIHVSGDTWDTWTLNRVLRSENSTAPGFSLTMFSPQQRDM